MKTTDSEVPSFVTETLIVSIDRHEIKVGEKRLFG